MYCVADQRFPCWPAAAATHAASGTSLQCNWLPTAPACLSARVPALPCLQVLYLPEGSQAPLRGTVAKVEEGAHPEHPRYLVALAGGCAARDRGSCRLTYDADPSCAVVSCAGAVGSSACRPPVAAADCHAPPAALDGCTLMPPSLLSCRSHRRC